MPAINTFSIDGTVSLKAKQKILIGSTVVTRPIQGATVAILSKDGTGISEITDSKGHYRISNIPIPSSTTTMADYTIQYNFATKPSVKIFNTLPTAFRNTNFLSGAQINLNDVVASTAKPGSGNVYRPVNIVKTIDSNAALLVAYMSTIPCVK